MFKNTPYIDSHEDPLFIVMLTHAGDDAYITAVVRADLQGVASGSLYIASMGDERAVERTRFGACDGCSRSMAQFRARRQVGSTAPLHLRLFTVAGGGERVVSLFNVQWDASEALPVTSTRSFVAGKTDGTRLLILYPVSRAGHLANFRVDQESDVDDFMSSLSLSGNIPDGEVRDELSLALLLELHVGSSLLSLHGAELPGSVSPVLGMLFAGFS